MRRLFEQVPGIYEGTVRSSRSPASPASVQVAVHSLDDRLDPWVPASAKGGVFALGELRGERVDVILWDADLPSTSPTPCSPAKVTRVRPHRRRLAIIVPDDGCPLHQQGGPNARLAARLTGWHIDIKSETLAADILKGVPVHEARRRPDR